jgi:integrase
MTDVNKHTPGPWRYQEESDAYTHIVRGPENLFISQLSQDTSGVAEANARLIAAAPEMLEALEAIVAESDQSNGGKRGKITNRPVHERACRDCNPQSAGQRMNPCVSIPNGLDFSREKGSTGQEDLMARRRYQSGSIERKGTREPKWFLRYLEYAKDSSGETVKINRSALIGTVRDIPTKRAAKRAAEPLLDQINANALRPRHLITFGEFAEKWKTSILPNHKPSSQSSEKAHLTRLSACFGSVPLSELSTEVLQRWITSQNTLASKTTRNYVGTMRTMWRTAKSWGYVQGNPFEDLIMPSRGLVEKPCLTPDQAREIIRKADEPFKTMFWIVAETGMRGGEVCGLLVEDVDFENCLIHVRRSAWRGKLQTPKTGNAVRHFPISKTLVEHIQTFCGGVHAVRQVAPDAKAVSQMSVAAQASGYGRPKTSDPQRLLFHTSAGTPYDNYNVVSWHLKPLLEAIGITNHKNWGLHAFRRTSASVLGSIQAAPAVVKERLGHGTFDMSMHYMSAVSADHRAVADKMGRVFDPNTHHLIDSDKQMGRDGKPSSHVQKTDEHVYAMGAD